MKGRRFKSTHGFAHTVQKPSISPRQIGLCMFNIILAGPALFRRRLRAVGKCTDGVALSKGRPNLARDVHLGDSIITQT